MTTLSENSNVNAASGAGGGQNNADTGNAVAPKENAGAVTSKNKGVVAPKDNAGAKGDNVRPQEQSENKKFKIKVNGTEQEIDESEIIRLAQMGKSAYKKFEEAASERKKVEKFKQGLKSNFVDTLKKMAPELGLEPTQVRQMVEDYLVDQIRVEQMSPEQKQHYQIEQELKNLKERETYRQQEDDAKQMMTMQERYAKEYDIKFTEALKAMNIPKTPFTVARMATYMSQALENGYDLDPMDAVKLVHEDYKNDIKATFGDMNGEQILSLIGESNAQKIRQHDVSKIKNKYNTKSASNKQDGGGNDQQQTTPKKDKSWADWQARLDRLENGEETL